MGREALRCPRCGVTFALVVGEVGPCEPCIVEMRAEREARRGLDRHRDRAPRVAGSSSSAPANTAARPAGRERGAGVTGRPEPMRVEPVLCSCCETVIGLLLLDVATCERCGQGVPELDEAEALVEVPARRCDTHRMAEEAMQVRDLADQCPLTPERRLG